MREAIGAILPFGVGVALSPVPIIAVILMLVSAKARVNGPMFILGWLVGLAVVGIIVLAVAGPAESTDDEGQPATWVAVVELVLGVLLLLLAVKQWRGRPREGDVPEMPKWMGAIDGFTPVKSAGAGALLSGLNPKNLLFSVAAGTAIAQTGIDGVEQAVAYAVFALIATTGVAIPVVVYFALGDRAPATLQRLQAWMAQNNAVIMSVLILVIGVKVLGDGLGKL
jgi:threonine/homoserine/homoserine lactone efflux protein